ncbi:AAA family ATPase [uncultured Arcticibacterium sp.]|uniref:AAA family ATPase n=1 Tax=uncultured Arcticibacterium sp. TaxID=2173042 RepID=UPI0030F67C04
MAHLNYFGVKNFRIFNDMCRFNLKPITILIGENSSGKSSLTKAILTLKESFSGIKRDFDEGINTYSIEELDIPNQLHLGNFGKIKNRNSESDIFIFELPFKFISQFHHCILRINYKLNNNSIQNASLISFQIVEPTTNENHLHYDLAKGELRICYTKLLDFFKSEIPKYLELERLQSNKENLIEPFMFDGVAQEHLFTEELKKNLSLLEKDILELKVFYDRLAPTAWHAEYIDSFKSSSIYRARILSDSLNFHDKLPLFNYCFLFHGERADQMKDNFLLSDTEREQIILKNNIFWNKINLPFSDFYKKLRGIEIKILEDFIFKEEDRTFSEFTSFTSMSKGIAFKSNFFKTTFLEKLCEYIPEILEVYEVEEYGIKSFENSNLLLKPKTNSAFQKADIFFDKYFFQSITNGFSTLSSIFKSIEYIPSVRYQVERIIINNSNSFLQELLVQIHKTQLSKDAITFINKYLELFNVANEIQIEISEDSSTSKIIFLKNGLKEELADLGYGISQIVPIILKMGLLITNNAANPKYGDPFGNSSIVIIEEPETNLHPALQSKLAEMIIECYQTDNIQIIVETHSEYFIRKMQYLIAKKAFKAEDAIIYNFRKFNNDETESNAVKPIKFNKDGSLSENFYPGFFDEASSLELELLKIKRGNSNLN